MGGLWVSENQAEAAQLDPENTLIMDLPSGPVVIAMRPDLAPNHVARIKELVREGFYDGLVFHRVIPDFMAQTGDPQGTGAGGSGKKLKAEFSTEKHVRGTVSMARTNNPDSADSQFFICLDAASWLNRKYTIWGQVVEGMDNVDKIKQGSAAMNGSVDNPTAMISVKVMADVERMKDMK
ncbi:MAG: peptidylprolyl isomerase [Rhodospirillaceae bacterium]|nr:peptidylprolyl isomerase [Rhodospirillaceae bacterium]